MLTGEDSLEVLVLTVRFSSSDPPWPPGAWEWEWPSPCRTLSIAKKAMMVRLAVNPFQMMAVEPWPVCRA